MPSFMKSQSMYSEVAGEHVISEECKAGLTERKTKCVHALALQCRSE
jgi:hypothetical protein